MALKALTQMETVKGGKMEIKDVIKLISFVNASYHREPPRYTFAEQAAIWKIIEKVAPTERHDLAGVLEIGR